MTQENNWTYPNTAGWAEFPFSYEGQNYLSKMDKTGSFYPRIIRFSESDIQTLNQRFIQESGIDSTWNREQITTELIRLNEGASQAVIELV